MSICNRHFLAVLSLTAVALPLLTLSCQRNESPAPAASAAATPNAPPPAVDPNRVYDATHPLEISVTSDGFVPERAKVRVGQPITLVVTRKVERTCATDIVIKDYGVNKPLPQGERVEVTFTPTKPGPIRFACAMDMVSGELVAE